MSEVRLGFLGRAQECQSLDAMLAWARDGQSAVLVIRGEPGIGKTALLRYAAREASGFRIIEVEGIEAEMELPFAGIQRLCAPVLEGLDDLAELQRNALKVAFGVSSGTSPDGFLVGVAVLNLLAAAAEERPLLCLVDDAQWLDGASVQALGFAARRLLAEPIAMLLSLREPITTHGFDGLPELSLEGLSEPDAQSLLARAVPGRLNELVRDRIIGETNGNPLALVELSQRMSAAERAAGFAVPAAGDLPPRLREHYRERIAGLPDTTQHLMLLAAAEPLADASVLWRAAERLSIDPDALAPAAEAKLLEIDDRVRFHHPLVRSAVYRAASPDQRRRAHEALAAASDPELEADRQAWHLALAAAGPDEAVAAALERSAGRAQRRGGLAAAAALLERATWLTSDPKLQAERALAAAEATLQAGAFGAVARLLSAAEAGSLDGLQSARSTFLRGRAAMASAYGNEAAPLLLEAARQLQSFDLRLARRAFLTAWFAAIAADHLGRAGMVDEISRAVRALPPLPTDPDPLDLALEAFALLSTEGYAVATPVLRRAAKAVLQLPAEDVLRWGWMVASAAQATWDEDVTTLDERQTQAARDAGALGGLTIPLQSLAQDRAWEGDLAGAARLSEESDSITAAMGVEVAPYARLRILALQGREAEAAPLIEAVIDSGTTRGQGSAVMLAHWSAAVLYNGLGRHEQAAAAAREVTSKTNISYLAMWARVELIEAAARVGDAEVANEALDRLCSSTGPAGTDFGLGMEARSRALLADGDDAEPWFREAIERLGRARRRPELARSHLVYGAWLRGESRLGEAREQLRTAERMFDEFGMEAFAERARSELVGAGAKQRQRRLKMREELTPQEQQIGGLARDGLTNAEIGAQLFLSPRTVEWHLHKVFQKLGIDSRGGLLAALGPPDREAAGA